MTAATVAGGVEDDGRVEFQVKRGGVGPCNGGHFIAAIVSHIAVGVETLVGRKQRQMAAFVE